MQRTDNPSSRKNFRGLVAWQKAHAFSLTIYRLTSLFSTTEQYGLISQMRRAAVSVSSNIAEGYGRVSANDKGHFYVMAGASVRELQSQLSLAKDLSYMSEQDFVIADADAEEVLRLINGLLKAHRSSF